MYILRNTLAGTWFCTCYHSKAAALRFPAFHARPTAIIVPTVESVPEPPTPAASAGRAPQRCQAALYPACDCARCAVLAAA